MLDQIKKMLKKSKNPKNEGFTIIEVMIVLAIAALILLIVLLAVPALQRSSRNTTRKNDISNIAGAISTYESNNNGQLPSSWSDISGDAKVSYYTGGNGTGAGQITFTSTAAQGALTAKAANDRVVVVTGAQCDSTTQGATIAGSARQLAIQYLLETGSTWTPECQSE